MVGKKRHPSPDVLDLPIDLASRIGASPAGAKPASAALEAARRHDAPIEAPRPMHLVAPPPKVLRPATPTDERGRPLLIGAEEPRSAPLPDVQPPVRVAASRPAMIGLEEALAVAVNAPLAGKAEPANAVPQREVPGIGEMDLVVTPLATPDDWHHFELALRRVPGVGPLRIEYYRAGILKLRLRWSGAERFAEAIAGVPGYRIGILGEDRSTVQIRVARA